MQVAEYVWAPCAEPHDAAVTADAMTLSGLFAACISAVDTRFDVHASGVQAGPCTRLCAWHVGNLTLQASVVWHAHDSQFAAALWEFLPGYARHALGRLPHGDRAKAAVV